MQNLHKNYTDYFNNDNMKNENKLQHSSLNTKFFQVSFSLPIIPVLLQIMPETFNDYCSSKCRVHSVSGASPGAA